MILPTVPVTCRIYTQAGQPLVGAALTFTLSCSEVYDSIVVPTSTAVTTDDTGTAIVNLFPNSLGTNNSYYIVKGKTHEIFLNATFYLPNLPKLLEDIV